jgi:hypothetical protein
MAKPAFRLDVSQGRADAVRVASRRGYADPAFISKNDDAGMSAIRRDILPLVNGVRQCIRDFDLPQVR